jgi:hypothetical protein
MLRLGVLVLLLMLLVVGCVSVVGGVVVIVDVDVVGVAGANVVDEYMVWWWHVC